MYSQDLPDQRIYFPTLKEYDRLYSLWVFYLQKTILRVCPYLRLLAVMINSLSNLYM
jgi:hypothetical protein